MIKKPKQKPWDELKDSLCPNCGNGLQRDLFGQGYVGFTCGFILTEETKDLLITRFKNGSEL